MKICHIGAKTIPPRTGGIERHVFEIAKRQSKLEHEVHVIAGACENTPRYEYRDNIHIHTVPTLWSRYLTKPSMIFGTKNSIASINPEIIHVHDAFLSWAIGRSHDSTYIQTLHGLGYLRKDWPTLIRQLLYKVEMNNIISSKGVIAVDQETFTIASKINPNVVLIPTGVDIPQGKYTIPERYNEAQIRIFAVGRLIASKGFSNLIQAIQMLSGEGINQFQLYIAGEGPERVRLEKLAKKSNNITMLGYVQDIAPYYSNADIFVMPSDYEGLPATLLEAMAHGNASVSTSVGDIPTRFEDKEEILLCRPDDVLDLKEKLSLLIRDAEFRGRLGENARKKMAKEYDWDIVTKKIIEIYKSTFSHVVRK